MRRYLCLTIVFCSMFDNTMAEAYELATHARLSWNGYLQSRLNLDAAKRGSLGLPKGSYTDLGGTYHDNAPDGQSYDRGVKDYDFDNDKFPVARGPEGEIPAELLNVIPPGWLMRGAVREDDISKATAYLGYFRNVQPPPFDDPYGNFDRVCNHFFDPFNNTPFTGPAAELCGHDLMANAPQWAFGTVDSPIWPNIYRPNATRRNHFTVLDAREAMWRALSPVRECGHVA